MMKISQETEHEIRSLYERYSSMVYRRCRLFLKSEDDARDAAHEVFMKLIRSFDTIARKESIYSWLLRASTNHCISLLRKKKHEQFDENAHGCPDDDRLPQERRLLLKEISRHYLAPWNEKIRQVVIYTYIDGYRQDEVARLTNIGESTVRRYLTRFRRCAAGLSLLKREDVA